MGAKSETPLTRTRGAAGARSPGEPSSRTGAKMPKALSSTSTCSGAVTLTGAKTLKTVIVAFASSSVAVRRSKKVGANDDRAPAELPPVAAPDGREEPDDEARPLPALGRGRGRHGGGQVVRHLHELAARLRAVRPAGARSQLVERQPAFRRGLAQSRDRLFAFAVGDTELVAHARDPL